MRSTAALHYAISQIAAADPRDSYARMIAGYDSRGEARTDCPWVSDAIGLASVLSSIQIAHSRVRAPALGKQLHDRAVAMRAQSLISMKISRYALNRRNKHSGWVHNIQSAVGWPLVATPSLYAVSFFSANLNIPPNHPYARFNLLPCLLAIQYGIFPLG